jgi:predicted DNA-binding protein with PD1-like motif
VGLTGAAALVYVRLDPPSQGEPATEPYDGRELSTCMIITQTRESRHFVGSMNPGTDMVESLTQICVDNSILCGHFSGVGYLRNPKLQTYNVNKKGFEDAVELDGTFHVVSMHGNVSLQGKKTVFRCHVVGMLRAGDEEPQLQGGELVGGEVVAIEFSLSTIDDIRLYRVEDDRTGLDPWLHMDLSSGDGEGKRIELPIIETAPGSAPPEDKVVEEAPPEEPPPPANPEVLVDDWLDHPTLGTAKVLAIESDEKVTIELESGRKVQLHIGLLQLAQNGTKNGGRLFKVSIRRRR